jgi:hypothetical protein
MSLGVQSKSEQTQNVMERIKLKVSTKAWLGFFIVFFAFSSGLIFLFLDSQNFSIILTTAFFASVIVIGVTVGIFYFFQKEVILTNDKIKKVGFPSKSIAYNDIQKIKVGTGGFSIYDEGKSPINITTMYSNFEEAKKMLNQKIRNRSDIEINGFKLFINKYLNQK